MSYNHSSSGADNNNNDGSAAVGAYKSTTRRQAKKHQPTLLIVCVLVVTILCVGAAVFLAFPRHHRLASLLLLSTASVGPATPIGSGSSRLLDHHRQSYYTPSLRDDLSTDNWDGDRGIIHIVKTRFMQEQGNLTALGLARLALFRVFCLPTMQHQSTQNFLWIIKVDPSLDESILRELTGGMPMNAYVVASNANFRVNENFPGGWRDGAEPLDISRSRVYTGNRTLLEAAMALQDRFPVLETRLDADDGLHRQFLETVQTIALRQLDRHPRMTWMYWCSRRHMEWHWMDPLIGRTNDNKNKLPAAISDSMLAMILQYGTLQGITHEKLCVTPGITTGFAVNTKERDVPVFAHHELARRVKFPNAADAVAEPAAVAVDCGLASSADCLQFMESFVFEAIRSRAPTSHGMLKVQVEADEYHPQWWVNYAFWNMLHESFGISRPEVGYMNQYLTDHLVEIARDNILGQCTTGHSCKESAKADLEQLIAARSNYQTNSTGGSAAASD
jgi:Putative rhamnosyl transferase